MCYGQNVILVAVLKRKYVMAILLFNLCLDDINELDMDIYSASNSPNEDMELDVEGKCTNKKCQTDMSRTQQIWKNTLTP